MVSEAYFPCTITELTNVLTEIPLDPKSGSFDPFRAYPSISASDLPSDLPTEHRNQLQSLLHDLPDVDTVAGLKNAHRDSSGHMVIGSSVVNRPWEWIENIGEAPLVGNIGSGNKYLKGKEPVKNTGSLSLLTFGARATGDTIMSRTVSDPEVRNNLRIFERGLSTEGPFVRDWQESRLESGEDLAKTMVRQPDGGHGVQSPLSLSTHFRGNDQRGTPRGSPVSTSGNSRGSVSSMRHSPNIPSNRSNSGHNAFDAIDVDSLPNLPSSSNKRKAGQESDDDIVLIEDPHITKKAKAPVKASKKR